jgi:hypothetical protein
MLIPIILCILSWIVNCQDHPTGAEDRAYWVKVAVQLADPILTNLANDTLIKNMPYESLTAASQRKVFSHLEAVGRLLDGLAPWLELGADDSTEGKIREKYIELAVKGLSNAVNPNASDYLNFVEDSQPLVDAAFLAQALLRAPTQLWEKLDQKTKNGIITEFKRSRVIKPGNSNWLLFASMIETFLMEVTGEFDEARLMNGINTFHNEWYKGDSFYGDGPHYHQDYYNSFVIHPFLCHILPILKKHNHAGGDFLNEQLKRHTRYAEILERFIGPDGTYPIVGRSICYRFGVFHGLSDAALIGILPSRIEPAQVRCGLTAVMKRVLESPKNFDENGWLRVGVAGPQLNISEGYINTGSVYLTSFGLLPLGLPPAHKFWSDKYTEWTAVKAWSGKEVHADHALD